MDTPVQIADYFQLTLGSHSSAPAAQMFRFWRLPVA
jgi:hypothetical protein